MATIESLVSQLNDLCRQFATEKEQFKEYDKLMEMFMAIKDQGYTISWPSFSIFEPEYELLSEEGRRDFERLIDFRKMKLEAVSNLNFDRAADFRDIERELIKKIRADFFTNNQNQHFILAGKFPEIVIFNDPDSLLITLFK